MLTGKRYIRKAKWRKATPLPLRHYGYGFDKRDYTFVSTNILVFASTTLGSFRSEKWSLVA